ncbi:hypothetical protein PGT21_050107 [Puccinia graminis f. sp. tritici]|uniref:CCHC-type domain-containing protein n=1 Tax=Puccinia graminis f. sp. tritici TaxID=56615 RepID=A0A5B0M0R2_PUCGR|nr:hypothetical protein PGT21_050107 [Puccinia graminis f. sp. tritici]KAA1090059.1 hypothetical protein PGTUg99_050238 [Puccinia graminis f. sp. tritici]
MSRTEHERNVWSRASSASVASTNGSESEFDVEDGASKMGALFDAALGGSDNTEQAETTIKSHHKGKQVESADPPRQGPSTSHHTSHHASQGHRPFVSYRMHHDRHAPPHQAPQSTAEKELLEFQAAKMRLEQAKLISQTVSAINARWKTSNVLRADGSNFSQWTRDLREIGTSHLSDPDFFFSACDNSTFERIGRLVVFAGVHQDLVPDIQPFGKTVDIFNFLKKKFSANSRAAQMNLWRRLSGMTINHLEPSTSIVAQIRDLYTELKALNGRLCSDVVFGFLFQSAVMQSSAPFKKDFELRVENQVQNDASKVFPKFEDIVHNYNICQKQWSEQSQPNDVVGPQMPSVMQASATDEDFDFEAFLAEIPEDDWSEALEFFSVTARRCWHCKAPDHYLRDCPQRSGRQQPTGIFRGPSGNQNHGNSQRQMATFVGSLYTQPGGNQGAGRSQTAPPSQFQTQAKRMADFYRPRYQQSQNRQQSTSTQPQQSQKGGASAQVMEIGDVPDDLDDLDFRAMTLGEDILPPPTNPILPESGTLNST